MSIIRSERVEKIAILSSSGELHQAQTEESLASLLEEEGRQAFQKGKTKGEQIGYKKASEESHATVKLLQTIAKKMLIQKTALLDQLKPEIIEFVITVCDHIIRRELSQPESLVHLINSLLRAAATSLQDDLIHIILAPNDLVRLEKHLNQIQYDKREIKSIRFGSDPMMREGDCRIETKTGLLNYDISRELADLKAKILYGEVP